MQRSIAITGCLAAMLIAGLQVFGTPAPGVGSAERGSPAREGAAQPWAAPIREMDAALAQGGAGAARRAWHRAYRAAFTSRGWEGMLEVGEARLRLGQTLGGREDPRPSVRRLYLADLLRAREARSLGGVLGAAEAFAALGDREVVEQTLHLADGLAARSGDAQGTDRLRAFRERWAARPLQAEGAGGDRP